MSRVAQAVPVSPKMLRHFAAVTVAITFCVAIFADGEGREAIAAQVEAREARTNLLQAEADKLGTRRVAMKAFRTSASHGSNRGSGGDSGGDFGAPMDDAAGNDAGSGWTNTNPGIGPSNDGPPNLVRTPAPTAGQAEGASDGPPNLASRNPRARRPSLPPRPTEAQLEALLAASRARSGRQDSSE